MLSLILLIAAAGPESFAVDASKSTLKYHIVHKLHQVDAESKAVEARAVLQPDGMVMLMARSAVGAFKSGEGNRDEHMQEVVEANKFPFVTLKGTFKTQKPATFPAEQKVTVGGELDFHGVKQALQIPVTIAWQSATEVHITSTFNISLDAYKIDRPALLFVKIEDACRIDVDAWLKE